MLVGVGGVGGGVIAAVAWDGYGSCWEDDGTRGVVWWVLVVVGVGGGGGGGGECSSSIVAVVVTILAKFTPEPSSAHYLCV